MAVDPRLAPASSVNPPYPEAQFVVTVSVRQVFPNCPQHLHKQQRIEPSKFVPRTSMRTPVPGWKRMDWARDLLPAGDPVRVPEDDSHN